MLSACEPGETAIRAELQFDECLSADRIERITVVLASGETTITRNLSRASYRIRDGFSIRLVPAEGTADAVTVAVTLIDGAGVPIAGADAITTAFEPGRVVPLAIELRCDCDGSCGGPPSCGSPDACVPVRCPPEDDLGACGNFADDDCDGTYDCCDPDCAGVCGGMMAPGGFEDCFDGGDNDCNGYVDCEDPSCFPVCGCRAPVEVDCFDLLDDDCDMATDCQDPDCAGSGCCEPQMMQELAGFCGDAVDNDCDFAVDCCDPDCSDAPGCASSRTEDLESGTCDNRLDDDCDGAPDCCDDACFESPRCVPLAGMMETFCYF